ncbi:MAG: SDR family oxidoreductase [Geminicoccaceae bacterium]|nr:SDR family oxidoreductase [Geminicoccaceae bacterium]
MPARTVIVTGGSRGIGAATCRKAAQAGFQVAIAYRDDEAAARQVERQIADEGGRAACFRADVGVENDVVGLFDAVDKHFGSIHGLVNNAGISSHMRAQDADAATLARLFNVNVVGLMICCREAVRRMSTRAEVGGKGGVIVNISSMAAFAGGRPGATHYAASKGAVDLFTLALAKEVAGEGIRVNAVRPGVTETDMVGSLRTDREQRAAVETTIPMGRLGRAEEVAAAVAWLLGDEASFVSGTRLDVAGGGFTTGAATQKG